MDVVFKSLAAGGKVLLMGNGGSAGDAQHIAAEFVGRYKNERRALPAIALTVDTSAITAIGNDYGYDLIFDRQVEALCAEGDSVIGISTSGNSENVIRAAQVAKLQNITVFGMLGQDGGKLKSYCDQYLIAPGNTSDRIQEIHMLVLHILIEAVEESMFPDIVKQPREPGKYHLSEVQFHRKHGQVGIYRLKNECESCPSYLVLTWFQANNFKVI